jgi:anti-sigma B factor antagonist
MSINPGSNAEPTSNGVLVGLKGEEVLLQVEGRGTHLNSEPVRMFLIEMMEKGVKAFRLRLNHCTYLDSTFIGVLTGACLKLKSMAGGVFSIDGVGNRNLELLQTLGVVDFFEIYPSHPGMPEHSDELHALCSGTSGRSVLGTVLEAHKTLARLDERNAVRFKDVIDCLERERPLPQTSSQTSEIHKH